MGKTLRNFGARKYFLALIASVFSCTASAADFYNETLNDGAEAIIISGEIVAGDEERFRELSVRYPDAVVALSSFGGALVPALEIGRMIRLRAYTTVILEGEVCVSSCALIWVAGERRLLAEDALVGFHASYIDANGTKVESGVANAIVGHYLSQLNLSQKAVIFATSASPDEVAWLSSSDQQSSPISFDTFHDSEPAQDQTASPPPILIRPVLRGEEAISTYDWFKAQVAKPSFAVDGARGIGADGALLVPMAEHLRLIYSNDAIIKRVAVELDAARIDPRKNPQAAGSVMFNLSAGSTIKGLSRLPQEYVNRFFQTLAAAIQVGDDNCAGFVGSTGRVNIAEFEKVYAVGPKVLDQYLDLIRRGMFAEIENYPARISLRKDQIEIAEIAWSGILADKLAGWSDQEIQRFVEVLDSIETAPRAEACAAMRIIYPAVSGMEGLAGDWFRRVYLSYITDTL